MSLWTQRFIILSQKDIPEHIKYKKEERRNYEHLCFWIEITSGKIDGNWLITYLVLELGLGYPVIQALLLQFNIPTGREICSNNFKQLKNLETQNIIYQFLIDPPDVSERIPEEKYKRSLLSRGFSNFGDFLALDIDKLTPKELAEWVLKVNFEYPELWIRSSGGFRLVYQLNLSVEDLLIGKEVEDQTNVCETLKMHLKEKQRSFSYMKNNIHSLGFVDYLP